MRIKSCDFASMDTIIGQTNGPGFTESGILLYKGLAKSVFKVVQYNIP